MNNMFSYARVSSDTSCNNECKSLNMSKLHPIDQAKVVTEQFILADYLKRVDCEERGKDLYSLACSLHNSLPRQLTTYSVYTDFYSLIVDTINNIRTQRFNSIDPKVLIQLFETDTEYKYDDCYYTSTLPKTFLYSWMWWAMNYADREVFVDGKLQGALFLIPSIRGCYCKDSTISNIADHWKCILDFNGYTCGRFEPSRNTSGLINIVEQYSFPQLNLGGLIGLLSNFSIERDKYDMTNFGSQGNRPGIQDVCFDLVSYNLDCDELNCTREPFESRKTYSFTKEINALARMVNSGKLSPVPNNGDRSAHWIAPFITLCGADAELVNYITNPPDIITANEALSFKKSVFSTLIDERIIPGLEADDTPFDDNNDTDQNTNDATSGDTDSNDMTDDTGGDSLDDLDTGDSGESDNVDAEEAAEKVEHRPEIDPKMMILELTSPAVALSDYLYRDLVARRITYVLKNPPANAKPEVLQILKAWKSQWLFLVSIPTLRDFLSRIAIRLS